MVSSRVSCFCFDYILRSFKPLVRVSAVVAYLRVWVFFGHGWLIVRCMVYCSGQPWRLRVSFLMRTHIGIYVAVDASWHHYDGGCGFMGEWDDV